MKVYTTKPHEVILSAITKLEEFVKPTYGAAGRGILVDSYMPQILDDGYSVIEELELEDELENAVIKFVKEASRKTNATAGDGTTTAALIMASIVKEALTDSDKQLTKSDYPALANQIRKGLVAVVKKIEKDARKISTLSDLEKIAFNAFHDAAIAKIVAKVIHEVGEDGVVTVEEGDGFECESEVVTGMVVNRGYVNPMLATPPGETAEIKNPVIMVVDENLLTLGDIAGFFEIMLKKGKKEFVIFAKDIAGDALQVMIVNKMRGIALIVGVKAPGQGDQQTEYLQDIATMTGATLMGEKYGKKFGAINADDAGTAKRIIVGKDETTIVSGAGKKADIDERAKKIKAEAETNKNEYDKHRQLERVAKMVGGVGVIRVGAATEGEMHTTKAKVDDAVHATMLARKTGVVKGAGLAFKGMKTGSDILDKALNRPNEVLIENGRDAMTEGVEDAAGVVIAALESAVSIASTLMTAGGIIAFKKEKEKPSNE